MKRLHRLGWTMILLSVLVLGYRGSASANTETDGHALEAEVDGYRIALTSENEWAKGDNTILVTLTDGMGMSVNDAEVELLIRPSLDTHGESEASSHGPEGPVETTAEMEMNNGASHGSTAHDMQPSPPEAQSDGAEAPAPAVRMAFHGEGTYIAQAHLDSTGAHDVRAMVHVDGQMLQADFVVGGAASSSNSMVLWGFAAINTGIVFFAGLLRKTRLKTVRSLA
jgi:hypothetical protein